MALVWGKAFQVNAMWPLVENVVPELQEPQMNTSDFEGAKVVYSSIENK